MTWPLVLAYLRRVPGIAWVIGGAVVLLLAGLAFTYASGRKAGELRVHQRALQDSLDKSYTEIEHKTVEVERARKLAKTTARWSDSSRVTRQQMRADVEPMLASLPEPVVQLIRQDDKQVRRDSVTIQAFIAADTAWVQERFARIAADSLESHQIDIGREPRPTHHVMAFVAGAAIATAVFVGLHLAVR